MKSMLKHVAVVIWNTACPLQFRQVMRFAVVCWEGLASEAMISCVSSVCTHRGLVCAYQAKLPIDASLTDNMETTTSEANVGNGDGQPCIVVDDDDKGNEDDTK